MSFRTVIFDGLIPHLGVFDMPESLAFYRDLLGFEVVSFSPVVRTPEGEFSHWMWLRLGGAALMLNTQYDSGERPEHRDTARWTGHGDTSLYIGCSNVDAAYEQLTLKGLKADPPRVTPYGLKNFSVRDPDGYAIFFHGVPSTD